MKAQGGSYMKTQDVFYEYITHILKRKENNLKLHT